MDKPSKFATRLVTIVSVLVVLALLFILFAPSGLWVPKSKAITALESHGFSNVRITHRAVFFLGMRGADKSDTVRFTAWAKNPAGKEVEMYVYASYWKGATIRTP